MADEQAALRAEALAYLEAHHTVTLATVGEEGPWAAGLFYASEGFTLYFLSDPRTRHGRNLEANPRVAATIHEDYRDWRQIKGVQMEGTCQRVEGKLDQAKAVAVYLKKYPFVRDFLFKPQSLSAGMASRVLSTVWYRVTPTRVLFIDNSKGFGNRREVELG
ncbi:MAG: pyridoxamine 5'-phosphate oxidase family protein [Chloroflexi bacterium]|nr:pyridoxamine 5'-phosphate oxidase family protein [Chloroflexota bacterium]